jgi:hypothetical protein
MVRSNLLTAILCVAVSSAALAQTKKANEPKAKRPAASAPMLITGESPLDLLQVATVREELHLTSAQESLRKECQEKRARFGQASRKAFQELGEEPDPEALLEYEQRVEAANSALIGESDAAMVRSLDRAQRARLDQIAIQSAGPGILLRPVIQQRLNMDPGQIEAIRTILSRGRQETLQARAAWIEVLRQSAVPPANGAESKAYKIDTKREPEVRAAFAEFNDARDKISDSMLRAIMKLFTKKQRQAYQAMRGEPFDVASIQGEAPTTVSARLLNRHLEQRAP